MARKTVHEPEVHKIIKASSIFWLPTLAMRSQPEVILMEFMRFFTYGKPDKKKKYPAQLLDPDSGNYTDKEKIVIHALRGKQKQNKKKKDSPPEFFYAPAYPSLTRQTWIRGGDPEVIDGYFVKGVLSHHLRSIRGDEDRKKLISKIAEGIIQALCGQNKRTEIFSLCLDEFDLCLEDLKENIKTMLNSSVAKTQLFPAVHGNPLHEVASKDFLVLLKLEPFLPRQHWISMLMCYLRYIVPIWCLSQTKNTIQLVNWVLASLKGETPTQEEINKGIFSSTSKLLPVTLNPSRVLHEHVEEYIKSRVQLTCIFNSLIEEDCFSKEYFSSGPLIVSPEDKKGVLLIEFLNELTSKRQEYKNKITLKMGSDSGQNIFERYSVRLCEKWNAWLNPLEYGQGVNIIECMDMLRSAGDMDERGNYLIESVYTPYLMFRICPGPMALQVFTLWADVEKRLNGSHGKLTLSDLIKHFGYYGIDFQDQSDGLVVLMDRMKELGLLRGSPDAGTGAEIENPYKNFLKKLG
jgi:hypothetical protein